MKNKKVVWIIIGIVSIALIALAITYAYWQITKTQTGENEITTACLNISLVDAESGNTGVTLQDQYPLSDTEGEVLNPYKFTVTNNCDTEVDYQIAMESIGSSTSALSASSLKVMLDDTITLLNANESLTPTVSGAYASHKLGMGSLAKSGETGSSVTHTLRLWIDEAAPVSENNKSYTGKITVTIGQGIIYEKSPIVEGSLAYTLLNAYGGENKITELDSTVFETPTTEDDAGMYKAQDDYGISYYYRGNVTNNYVKFGETKEVKKYWNMYDGVYTDTLEECINSAGSEDACEERITNAAGPIYWRIVRINGDGTIRLIYDGQELFGNGTSHTANIGSVVYNSKSDHKMYVGYMYGTEDDPYGDNPETELTDSTIKEYIDNWYETHLKQDYENYISDNIFCNDREETDSNSYKSYTRLESEYEPVLTCSNKRDRFTVDDTTLGNGHLSNPIGLLTGDEAVMAGYSRMGASSNYINTNNMVDNGFWLSSPFQFGSDAVVLYVYGTSEIDYLWYVNNEGVGARPVINLKADVEFTIDEDGTYVITTN